MPAVYATERENHAQKNKQDEKDEDYEESQ